MFYNVYTEPWLRIEVQEQDSITSAYNSRNRELDTNSEWPPKLPVKPLVDLLHRVIQEAPWRHFEDELTEEERIERCVFEMPEKVVTWLTVIERCSQAMQQLVRLKVGNQSEEGEDPSSSP